MRRLVSAFAVALVITALGVSAAVAADHGRPGGAYPAQSSPFGQSYTQWAEDWLQWALGTPTPQNPFVNPDDCGPGASPRAWFLAGSFDGAVSATCTAPPGRGFLISPAGNFCSGATNGVTTTKELTECAFQGFTDITDVSVTVDDRPVRNIDSFFLVSPRFDFQIPDDNIFGVPAQTTPAVVLGHFVMIRPLPVGEHTIVGHVTSTLFPSGFAEITYHIKVTPRG
jgi:hypothetical protein